MYSWSDVWTMVLTKPGTETFELILNDPQASRQRAFKWIFITGTIGLFIQQLVNHFKLSSYYAQYGYDYPTSALFAQLGIAVVLGGIFMLLVFIIGNGITQAIARALGGVGTYGEYFYVSAAYSAPLVMVNVAVTAFAGMGGVAFGLVSIALTIYQLMLSVMALKAVNQFGTGRALLAIFMPALVILGIIMAIVILALVGPSLSASRF
jgi:hypothetical protein